VVSMFLNDISCLFGRSGNFLLYQSVKLLLYHILPSLCLRLRSWIRQDEGKSKDISS